MTVVAEAVVPNEFSRPNNFANVVKHVHSLLSEKFFLIELEEFVGNFLGHLLTYLTFQKCLVEVLAKFSSDIHGVARVRTSGELGSHFLEPQDFELSGIMVFEIKKFITMVKIFFSFLQCLLIGHQNFHDIEKQTGHRLDPFIKWEEVNDPQLNKSKLVTILSFVIQSQIENIVRREGISKVAHEEGAVVLSRPRGNLIWDKFVEEPILIDADILSAEFERKWEDPFADDMGVDDMGQLALGQFHDSLKLLGIPSKLIQDSLEPRIEMVRV